MSPVSAADRLLVDRIRRGEESAWEELIARFEGRLLAFVQSRLGRRPASEDVVQETFLGFLTSLPNYDNRCALESYLFAIAAHKLTDHLRREGRRPTLPLAGSSSSGQSDCDVPGQQRPASSIARSTERRGLEEEALAVAMAELVQKWRRQNDWEKLKCAELLFVRGMANKHAAQALGISEQAVANHKFDFLARLRALVRSQELSRDVFPDLFEAT